MNPIERAVANADKIQAANADLERMSRPTPTLHQHIAGMKPGEVKRFESNGATADVGYHAEQSYGDNGKKVPGAYIGYYTVGTKDGTRTFEHGPFATTEAAARRGASRDSKMWAAGKAADHIVSHFSGLFRDRRAQ